MDYIHAYHSPQGEITLASDGERLVGLWFEGSRHFREPLTAGVTVRDDLRHRASRFAPRD